MDDKEFEALVKKQTSLNPSERYMPALDRRQPIGGPAHTDKLALFWIAFFAIIIGVAWMLG